jgi:hypothetical protein
VHCRESLDFEWIEITRLIDVTPFGAGFTLKHPTERGRLLHMTIPMPRQLRVFDHVEDQYRVWALVRYARLLEWTVQKGSLFEVGVAFVGKHAPRSYNEDPSRRYEAASAGTESIKLAEGTEKLEPFTSSDQRAFTRHNIPVDILLEVLTEKGEVGETEMTVTENLSAKGATVFTSLKIGSGRFVRLTSQQFNITVHAAVRVQRTGADGISRIHLEFVDRKWPL